MSTDPRAAYDAVAELASSSPATTGKMFGMPCLMNNGKAFAGFHKDTMAFKLTGLAHAEALSLPGAHLFDPSGRGRPMREWVTLPADHASRWLEFGQEALSYSGHVR
jgi:hypothetical protein